MFCHLAILFFFFCIGMSVTLRGGALGVPQGGVRLVLRCEAVRGGGAEWEQWHPPHSPPDFIFHSDTHNQTGPLWCWFPSGWACACPRPLWVSPTTSPVRLGVSPAAAPTPMGVFSQRSEALFPPKLEPWVAWSALLPPLRLVYLCANVGPQGAPLCLPRSPPI